MLPLHAGSAILLSMCTFVIGYGLGWLHKKPPTRFHIVHVPKDLPPGATFPYTTPDGQTTVLVMPDDVDTIRKNGGA